MMYQLFISNKEFQGFRTDLTQTSLYSHRRRLEAWNFGFKKKRDCFICLEKTKALIICAKIIIGLTKTNDIIYALHVGHLPWEL